jgi:hypothetical protein
VVFIMQRVGHSFYEVKEPITAGGNVRAMLDIVRRPEPLRSGIVALAEQGIERIQHDLHAALFGFAHNRPSLVEPYAATFRGKSIRCAVRP